jgi:hypothetical protein
MDCHMNVSLSAIGFSVIVLFEVWTTLHVHFSLPISTLTSKSNICFHSRPYVMSTVRIRHSAMKRGHSWPQQSSSLDNSHSKAKDAKNAISTSPQPEPLQKSQHFGLSVRRNSEPSFDLHRLTQTTLSHSKHPNTKTLLQNQFPKMSINWWTVGSLYGAASVAFGAFGAHGLKSRGISDAKITSWSTAAHYQVNIQYLPIVTLQT